MVSGGGRGIGLAIAELFAEEGANVSICSRNGDALQQAAAGIEKRDRVRCLAVAGDLTEQGAVESWIDRTRREFGKIDILVNNASATRGGKFIEVPADVLELGLALKLYGYLDLARAVVPVMRDQAQGSIVNIIGVTGTQPAPGGIIGALAGAALINFTKALSDEVIGMGIRVNAVSPGLTATHRRTAILDAFMKSGMTATEAEEASVRGIPIARAADPQEIASVAVFVASERASYMVGTTVNVDGGHVRGI